MCFQINIITTAPKPRITHCRQRNPNNMRTLPMSANTLLSFSIGLRNCQSAFNKADLITFITSHSRLNLMALTESWIKPEDNATPAALSNNFSFPRLTGRGGGTGLLISNNWKFTPLSSRSINSFNSINVSHSVTFTYPLKINFFVVYFPPGPLVNFVEELDLLLSTFPEDFLSHSTCLFWSQESVNYGYSQIRQPTGPYLHTTLLHWSCAGYSTAHLGSLPPHS